MSQLQEELFTFMAHAQDLQKIADTQFAAVGNALKRLEEGTGEAVAALIREDVKKSLSEANTALTGAARGLLAAKDELTAGTKAFRFSVTFYPVIICLLCLLFMGGMLYFGVSWAREDRDKAKAEAAAINAELAKTAFVTDMQGQAGKWVQIDKSRNIVTTTDGGTFALMPKR
jgi:hypothetical protein